MLVPIFIRVVNALKNLPLDLQRRKRQLKPKHKELRLFLNTVLFLKTKNSKS